MIRRYLGPEFDIHGGGIDLRFPHHENEQAQSTAAGDPFAHFWMHNAWVTMAGEKMSKSLGNTLAIEELLHQARAVDLRFYLATVHYRSTIEFSDTSLTEARAAYERIENFVERTDSGEVDLASVDLPQAFVDAMNDDINVSEAMAVVYDAVREGNTAHGRGDDARAAELATQVRAMLDVFGLDPCDEQWSVQAAAGQSIDAMVEYIAQQRYDARKAKDFATADRLRDLLADSGIAIEDTPDGWTWTR